MTNVESGGLMQCCVRHGNHSILFFLVFAAVVSFVSGCASDVRREIRFASGLRVEVLGEEGHFRPSEESYSRCDGIGLMPRFSVSRQIYSSLTILITVIAAME
jgi:hypothetical protein